MEPAMSADEPLELCIPRLPAQLHAAMAAGEADGGGAQHPAPLKLEASLMPTAPAAVPAQSAPSGAGGPPGYGAAAEMPLAAHSSEKAADGKGDDSDSDSCIVLSSSPPSEDDEAAGPGRAAATRHAFRRSYALRRRSAAPPEAPPLAALPSAELAGDAAGGASVPDVRPVLGSSPSAAQPLLGVRVMVPFVDVDGETRLFPGVVERRVAGRGAGACYLVVFDDGDQTVVAADELLALLSGKDTSAEQGAAAGAQPAGASPSTRRGGGRRDMEASLPKRTSRNATCEIPTAYRGVAKWPYPCSRPYRAWVYAPGGGTISCGSYATAKDAALAADRMARKHGMLHKLNFPKTAEEHAAVARGCAAVEEPPARRSKRKSDAAAAAAPQPPATRGRASGPPDRKSGAVLVELPPSRPAGGTGRRAPAPAEAAAAPSPEEKPAPTPAAAPPQQAAAPSAPAAAAKSAGGDAAAAFLRGIIPPLTCLDAALAELPRSGITAALLRHVAQSNASASPAERETRVNMLAGGLKIALPGDKLMLGIALDELARSA